jgi:acetylglutamate kinase
MTAVTVTPDAPAAAQAKAAALIEALPWLERFHGQTVVIKFGGHAMTDEALCFAFAQDVVFLRYAGLCPVVVHGGGPQVTEHLGRLGIPSTFTAGLRVTTPETMGVVRMVLTGQVNRDLIGLINRHGPFAVGMSGEDANLLTATRAQATVNGAAVDLGQVGDVGAVDPGALRALIADGRIPVISSVARGESGEIYNVNADTAAAAIAVALGAAKLVLLTDVPGLYANWPDREPAAAGAASQNATAADQEATQAGPGEVISELTADQLTGLLPGLSDGMIPKMQACLTAVRGGVPRAHVLDGRLPHAILLEIFTDTGIGTMVLPDGAGA